MTFSAPQRRDVRLLAFLRGASFLGDTVALVALFLRLAPVGHAWAIAALATAGSLPLVLLSPLAGHVVDHVPAKRMLTLLGVGEALICTGIGYWHSIAATLLLMALLSCAVAFSLPGYSALIPALAGEENIARAQGMMQSVQGAAGVVGPALGGLLVGWAGQSWPLYIDAISFALCAVGTSMLRHDRRPSTALTIELAESKGMMAGIALLWSDRILRSVTIVISVFIFALGMINVGEVFFATQTLHGSATQYGLIGASFGLGSIGGALYAGRLKQETVPLVRSVLLTIVVIGVMIGAVGLVEHIGYIYPLMVVAGFAAGIANVSSNTLLALRTPEHLRGRVFAAFGAIFTAGEIGSYAAGGLVLMAIAPRTVFQIAGIASTLAALLLGPLAFKASRSAHHRERDL
jgi:MFS family permease